MTGTQSKEIDGGELNSVRPTVSDIKILNLNGNIDIKVIAKILELQSL